MRCQVLETCIEISRVASNSHIPKGNHIQRLLQMCDKITTLERRMMAQQCILGDWLRINNSEILREPWIEWNVGQHGFRMQPKCFQTVHGQSPWSPLGTMGFAVQCLKAFRVHQEAVLAQIQSQEEP